MFGFFSFYSVLLLFFAFFYLFVVHLPNNERIKNRLFYTIAMILIALAAFRDETVGGDLESYLPVFYNTGSYHSFTQLLQYSIISGYEYGFVLICKAINIINNSSRSFIAITSVCSLIGPFYLIYKTSSDRVFSLFLFILSGFYNIFFNNVRQALALSVIMFSILLLLKNKNIHFLFGVIIASLIHSSAVFSLLLYPVNKMYYSSKKVVLLLFLLLAFYFIFGDYLLSFFVSNFFTKYMDNQSDALVSGTGYSLLAVRVFVMFICLYVFNRVKNKMTTKEYLLNKLFVFSIIVAVLCQLFASLLANLTRLSYYFYLPIIVLLPNLFDSIKSLSTRRFLFFGVFFVLYILMCITFLSPVKGMDINVTGTIPYSLLDGFFSW